MTNENRLIYANVAIEKCNKLLDNGYSCPNPDALEGVEIVRNLILSECETGCPTVDAVEVVHASWKRTPVSHILYCSSCDNLLEYQYRHPYCPNCGAKMDGVNEDENS